MPCLSSLHFSDMTLCIWDALRGTSLNVLHGHTGRIWDVDATVRGDRVLSTSADRSVKIWNWRKREEDGSGTGELASLIGNEGDVYAARWHPMGVSLRLFTQGCGLVGMGHMNLVADWFDVPQNHIATGGYDKIVRYANLCENISIENQSQF